MNRPVRDDALSLSLTLSRVHVFGALAGSIFASFYAEGTWNIRGHKRERMRQRKDDDEENTAAKIS